MQCPAKFFTDLERTNLNFMWKNKKPRIAKNVLNIKGTAGGITIPNFKLYSRATVLKTVWYSYENRQVDQWIKIKDPAINAHTYEHVVLIKKLKLIQCEKKAFSTNGAGITVCQHVE